MSQKRLGILALLLAVFFWGPAPVVTKLALTEIPQFSLSLLRGLIASIILLVVFYPRGYYKIKRTDLPLFALASLAGAVFNVVFFFWGIQLTTAISSQAIFSSTPVINALASHFILKEKINKIQTLGVAIGLLGTLVIATRELFETARFSNGGTLEGNVLVFLAAVSWVGYIIMSKSLLRRDYSPVTITSYSFLVSTVVFIPLALVENVMNSAWVNSIGFYGIFGVFYQSIFASIAAFLAYQTGLKLTSAFAAGVILYLNPVLTTMVAVPILGEKVTPPFLVGATLIIVGSAIATQFEIVKNHVRRRLKNQK